MPISRWIAAAIACVGLLIGLLGRGRVTHLYIAILIGSAALGVLRHAIADRWLPDHPISAYAQEAPILATITGRVATRPTISQPNVRAFRSGPKTRFLLAATEIEGRDGWLTATGKIYVNIKEPLDGVNIGDRVRMTGWLYRPSPPQNPGGFDWARHLRRQGVLVGLSCDHAAAVVVLKRSNPAGWSGMLDRLRRRVSGYLTDPTFSDEDPAAGVVSAMVLGQRSKVSKPMNEAFLKTGNVHFLAASGMHVAWLALLGWGFCRIIGIHYRISALLVGCLILMYVLLAEPRPSILRAGIIGILACATAFFRGRFNAVNSLACAAVLILMVRPTDLFTPAFQFSFLATLGLLHFCSEVSKFLAIMLFKLNRPRAARWFSNDAFPINLLNDEKETPSLRKNMAGRLAYYIGQLFAVSISEWLVTTPLACYLFDRFVPLGWLGTFILLPFAMLTTTLGFLTVLLGSIFPPSGLVLGPMLAAASHLMLGCVDLLSHLPGTMLDGRSPSLAWLLTVYCLIFLWSYRPNWIAWRWGFRLSAAILIVWWLAAPMVLRPRHDGLSVWMLAVGDGTGTIIELPDGQVLLYDFGTRSSFDAGGVGVQFLHRRGIRHIDSVFVSHPDFDHYGGIETIAEKIPIDRLVINDQFLRFANEKPVAMQFLQFIRGQNIPIDVIHGSHHFDGGQGVTLETIWPPAADQQMAPDDNDSSTVLRITYQGRSILLTGDIAEWGIAGLLARGDLQADALALPHHGSVVHNTAAFIDAVDPRIAVRSSGQPHRLTRNRIKSLVGDRRYFNTADDGCVVLQIKDGTLTARAVMRDD